jgi:hypothetical protein
VPSWLAPPVTCVRIRLLLSLRLEPPTRKCHEAVTSLNRAALPGESWSPSAEVAVNCTGKMRIPTSSREAAEQGRKDRRPDMSKIECYECHKTGHYARDCWSKNKGGSNQPRSGQVSKNQFRDPPSKTQSLHYLVDLLTRLGRHDNVGRSHSPRRPRRTQEQSTLPFDVIKYANGQSKG